MTGRKESNPIPDFDANGNLPPGIYKVTFDDIREKLAWSSQREKLIEGLEKVLENFQKAGIKEVYIAGSFTTVKKEPNDIDGCWVPNKDVDVNVLDPIFLDRDPPREKMKQKYGVDFLIAGVDKGVSATQPIELFFLEDRESRPKGILLLNL